MTDVSVSGGGRRLTLPRITAVGVFAGIRLGAGVLSALAPSLAARWFANMFSTPPRSKPPLREAVWMAGAGENRVRFDAERTMPLYSWGSGPTVLLVHGFAGRGSQMGGFVRPLLDQGFRVVSFDFVAHGDAEGRQTLLPEMAEALEVVMRHLGPVHGVIAHSLGAAATSLALFHGIEVNRLAYISPPDDPEVHLFRLAGKLGFSTRVAGRAKQRLEEKFGVPFENVTGTELVRAFDHPVLIVHDCCDSVVPVAEAEKLHVNWRGSQMLRTRDLGHNRILRDEGVIAKAVDFVAGG